jgi:hypothetical protein
MIERDEEIKNVARSISALHGYSEAYAERMIRSILAGEESEEKLLDLFAEKQAEPVSNRHERRRAAKLARQRRR